MMVRQRFLILLLGLAYSVMFRGLEGASAVKLDLGLSVGEGRAVGIVVVEVSIVAEACVSLAGQGLIAIISKSKEVNCVEG